MAGKVPGCIKKAPIVHAAGSFADFPRDFRIRRDGDNRFADPRSKTRRPSGGRDGTKKPGKHGRIRPLAGFSFACFPES
jgi:hypothetical protein